MGQCNAQTNNSSSSDVVSKLIIGQSTARLSRTSTRTKKESPSQPTLRGLELIKSCAKFYENGVGVAKPTIQLSHSMGAAVNKPATRQTSPSLSKASIGTVAVMCSFFLVLPGLALATIVWWGATKSEAIRGPELAAGELSAVSARTLQTATGAKAVSNEQSDIIIHMVKTQLITGDAWGSSGPR
jgi:hypothetical protein